MIKEINKLAVLTVGVDAAFFKLNNYELRMQNYSRI
jgi:hypothetical protein